MTIGPPYILAVPVNVPVDDALVAVAVADGAGSAEHETSRDTMRAVASDQRVMLMRRILLSIRFGEQSPIAGSTPRKANENGRDGRP